MHLSSSQWIDWEKHLRKVGCKTLIIHADHGSASKLLSDHFVGGIRKPDDARVDELDLDSHVENSCF